MELWFCERQTPHVGLLLGVKATLHRERTPYQELCVVDTFQYGRMLTLDGAVMTTEADEFVYHEMIALVPMHTHPRPRRVLVVGGGDGGVVREVLKHPAVERVDLVEIDEAVVRVSREFLPGIACALGDPRCHINIADGIEFVGRQNAAYDVIIVDSTDPVGPAVGLFSPRFHESVRRALAPGGVFVAQTESPVVHLAVVESSLRSVAAIFPLARLYLAPVPTYPGGLWSFTLGSLGPDPLAVPADHWRPEKTRFWTPDVHRAAFALPAYIAGMAAAATSHAGGKG
jgi:spermidine synthase